MQGSVQHLEQSSGMALLLYGSVIVSPVCRLQNVFSSVQVSVLKTTSISTHVQPLSLEFDDDETDDELEAELEDDCDELETELDELDDELDELDEDELDEDDDDELDEDSGAH